MDGGKLPPQSYKIRVKEEYEIEIYYQQGIIFDDENSVTEIVMDDAIELMDREDGLIACLHEESKTGNGYIAHVTTFDPKVEMVYNIPDMTMNIKRELYKRGINK